MVAISSEIPSGKPAALPHLPSLEILPNNNETATVASPSANYVAGSTYPLSTTDNFSDGALPPLNSPANGVDVDDCNALGPNNNLDGDNSISADGSANDSNDGYYGGGGKVRARSSEFPSAQPEIRRFGNHDKLKYYQGI